MIYLVLGKKPNIALYRCLNEDNLEKMYEDVYLDAELCYQIGNVESIAPKDFFINKLDKKYIKYTTSMTTYLRLNIAMKHMIYRIFK